MMKAGNLYATTISVLVSAVQKITRVKKLPEGLRLFRGLGGLMDLPNKFFVVDVQGCKCFVEWGFMSTTSNEQVCWRCERKSRRLGGRGGSGARAYTGAVKREPVFQAPRERAQS